MGDEIISLRIGKELKEKLRAATHINWSAVVRKALNEEVKKIYRIDKEKAEEAAKNMDKIAKSGVFSGGKTGTEIIREWRDKRK